MRNKHLGKELIIVFTLFILSAWALALDEDIAYRSQGFVMELDLKKNIAVINEKLFTWNEKTVFHNERGTPITNKNGFKVNTWVYIEGEFVGVNKPFLAKNIYFLSKKIGQKDKHLYPFIQ